MSYPYTTYPTYTYPTTSYNPITGQTLPTMPVNPTYPPTVISPVYNIPQSYPNYQYRPYPY